MNFKRKNLQDEYETLNVKCNDFFKELESKIGVFNFFGELRESFSINVPNENLYAMLPTAVTIMNSNGSTDDVIVLNVNKKKGVIRGVLSCDTTLFTDFTFEQIVNLPSKFSLLREMEEYLERVK